MKKNYLFISLLCIAFLSFSSIITVGATPLSNPSHVEKHTHLHISDKEFNALIKKGYTKQEIFRAYFISKHIPEKMNPETILNYYKKTGSWEDTAKHFGVDMEKIKREHFEKQKLFYKKNRVQIIQYLSSYTNQKPEVLEKYLKEGTDLHHLIIASAISKTSNKDLEQIIQYKKDGKDFKEIISTLKLDPRMVFEEVKKIHSSIRTS